MIHISPSLLAADFSRLGDEIRESEAAGADYLHLDVMDGSFVPNISFGFPVIESLRKQSGMVFDVHLMIDRPERYIERFVKAGADILTFHVEACADPASALREIRSLGCKAAISVKPKTPVEAIFPYFSLCDMVLVMTVEPGYGGQAFMPDMIPKVRLLKEEIDRRALPVDIEVDGGINDTTAKPAKEAGANVLVAGSAVFRAEDRAAVIRALIEA